MTTADAHNPCNSAIRGRLRHIANANQLKHPYRDHSPKQKRYCNPVEPFKLLHAVPLLQSPNDSRNLKSATKSTTTSAIREEPQKDKKPPQIAESATEEPSRRSARVI